MNHQKGFWSKYGLWIRLLISILLLMRAFQSIDWLKIKQALPSIAFEWIVLSIGLLWISNAMSGSRWGYIMQHAGFQKNYIAYIRLYFAGGLINQGLPTTLGGDSYRAISAFKSLQNKPNEVSLPMSFLGVLLDRSLGFAGNCILGAIGLYMGGSVVGAWVPNTGLILLLSMILGAFLIAVLLRLNFFKNLYGTLKHVSSYCSNSSCLGINKHNVAIDSSNGYSFHYTSCLLGLPESLPCRGSY